MSDVIDETLTDIFAGAAEITGAHAPWEMDLEREFIANVEATVKDAMTYLPLSIRAALAVKLWLLHEQFEVDVEEAQRAYHLARLKP